MFHPFNMLSHESCCPWMEVKEKAGKEILVDVDACWKMSARGTHQCIFVFFLVQLEQFTGTSSLLVCFQETYSTNIWTAQQQESSGKKTNTSRAGRLKLVFMVHQSNQTQANLVNVRSIARSMSELRMTSRQKYRQMEAALFKQHGWSSKTKLR